MSRGGLRIELESVIIAPAEVSMKGSGIILPMSQISFNEAGDIEVESFGNQPFRVMNVSPEKVKQKK